MTVNHHKETKYNVNEQHRAWMGEGSWIYVSQEIREICLESARARACVGRGICLYMLSSLFSHLFTHTGFFPIYLTIVDLIGTRPFFFHSLLWEGISSHGWIPMVDKGSRLENHKWL